MTMTPDVNVVVMDLKSTKNKELIMPNEDGSYTIVINSRFAYSTQLAAYNHAIKHISNEDFHRNDVQSIEANAHGMIIPDNAERIPGDRYVERIKELQAERRLIQRQMRRYEKKVKFLAEYAGGKQGFFNRAEDYKLYGDDL